MKVNVIFGPHSFFEENIPKNELNLSLLEFVKQYDLLIKGKTEEDEVKSYNNLVISSDEYAGTTDAFIEMMLKVLIESKDIFGYEKIFLHNPPSKVYSQIKKYEDIIFNELSYNFTSITKTDLKTIKKEYDSVILGQKNAKNEILMTLYNLVNDKKGKPVVIMLYGPPGVGKTETAYFLNKILFKESTLFRKQFSMLHNNSSFDYIFGDRSNSFSKDLIDRESNVLLLDEFDKCNSVFFSAFYQLFDEGYYEDKFYSVNLRNSIIFCTSNYNSEEEIKSSLGEAIYSRFDAFIKFNLLTEEVKHKLIDRIYEAELKNYSKGDRKLVKEFKKNDLDIPELLKLKSDKLYNVREIRRYIKKMIAYPIIENL